MSLLDDIPTGCRIALDSMIWIYEIEADPVFGATVHTLFDQRLSMGLNSAGTSLLTVGELLVQPLAKGRQDLADRYRRLLVPGPDLAIWPVTNAVVERAAALRAKYRLRYIDALHVASAIENKALLFLTNDAGLKRVTEVRVVTLSDHVQKA